MNALGSCHTSPIWANLGLVVRSLGAPTLAHNTMAFSLACAMVALLWLSTSSWPLGPTISTNAHPSWAQLWAQPHLASEELALALITCFVRSCLDHLVLVRALRAL